MKCLLFACVFLSASVVAQNKINRDYFINLLKEKKYGRVFDEASQLRQDKAYGKCAIIDYFIAKSLCLDNYPDKGREWLNYILQHYALSSSNRQFIRGEMQNCESVVVRTSLQEINPIPLPSAGVSGTMKGGVRYDCNSENRQIKFNDAFSEQFEERIFGIDQKTEAVAKLKQIVNDSYDVNVRDRFVLVTLKSQGISNEDVLSITNSLEKAYRFYTKYFNLRLPDKLITVYLLPDEKTLASTATLVHGASLPPEIYGYSLLSDLSLLGIATKNAIGTLYHELFHLVVRTDLGDIPAWLDEGLASLYSVSYWQNDTLYGNKHIWRIDQLDQRYLLSTAQTVPSFAQLFSYNWEQFNGGEEINLCQASVNYSLSNHLLIFLQDQNKLQALMQAFKNRKDPGGKEAAAAPTDLAIIQATLGLSADSLQAEFDKWFTQNYQFGIYAPKVASVSRPGNLTETSSYSDYKSTVRRMLDGLKEMGIPEKKELAAFEKRFAAIEAAYKKHDDKLQVEQEKWRKKSMPNINAPIMNQVHQVQQMAPSEVPDEAANRAMHGYFEAMEKERKKMVKLHGEVKQLADKYKRQTAS
ncbi:MAG: hypothetical protein EOO10_10795 [Chitinophagaceae bacterium]|nr:MAG: hypothetical protein EOO10_10795 [Chitinophagaceae bacterium]